jgi:hypothetical protein
VKVVFSTKFLQNVHNHLANYTVSQKTVLIFSVMKALNFKAPRKLWTFRMLHISV